MNSGYRCSGLHQRISSSWDQLKSKKFLLQNFNPENPLDPSLKKNVPYDPKVLKEIEKDVQTIM
jgi:hypothetical protein